MFTLTKVLCPIDFTPVSERALEASLTLSTSSGGDLYVLHVLDRPGGHVGADAASRLDGSSQEGARTRLKAMVGDRLDAKHVHIVVSLGDPAEEILKIEDMFGVDLIVLAHHSKPTLGRIFSGSVVEKVSRGSRANILIVKVPQTGQSDDLESL